MAEGTDSGFSARQYILHDRNLELESDCVCDDIHVNIPTSSFSRECTLEERFEKLPIFNKPLCLIHTDACGKLAVNESVLSQISLIDVPLNVVAVCGLYRTGKSYLMNRLAGTRTGFSLGATTKSHTKGIWAWCKTHPTQDGQILLLLDTEGLADIKKGDTNHDNHLFGLALLLSSTLIYNMMGVFNQEALEKLTFITRLSTELKVMGDRRSGMSDDSLIRAISPVFILCLRDFFLDIEVEDDDKQTSPDEYFEHCLQPDSRAGCESYNMTRECIAKYFPNRKCFTLSQPALKKKLKQIEKLDDTELDEDFVSEVDEMRDFVYEQKHKHLDAVTNVPVDGFVFASITSTYVETLRRGSPLTYQDAFAQVAFRHNSNLVETLVQEFSKDMDELELPVKRKLILQDKYGYQQNKTITKFRQDAYPYCQEDFEEKIMDKLRNIWMEVQNKNSSEVRKVCGDTLGKLYRDIIEKQRRFYEDSTGFEMYQRSMRILEKAYNEQMAEYDDDERMLVWQEFKSSKSDEKMKIYRKATAKRDDARYDAFKKEIEEKLRKGFEVQMKQIMSERDVSVDRQLRNMEELLFSIMSGDKEKTETKNTDSDLKRSVRAATYTAKEGSNCILM